MQQVSCLLSCSVVTVLNEDGPIPFSFSGLSPLLLFTLTSRQATLFVWPVHYALVVLREL